ncbi:hypothetical protein LARI1_G005798 [Lachnellula arida]|uniref:Uncharacterized protein n=1 Tax=Lachnellula arida TaxID=1316785 RepID=A0A8T9BB14_9HELO|nr:hypothetical protein LARI1_G005798 [Lachnellula arida]
MKTSLTGFTSPTSLVLFLLVPCTFALFSLSTVRFLYYGNWREWQLPAAPGDKIWFEGGFRKVGMQVHLWSVIPAIAMANRSFGGTVDTQCFTGMLAISTSVSVYKAWTSIRELKIDSHREWVLRTWAYTGSILSLRIVMVILILAINAICPTRFHSVLSCQELAYLYRPNPGGLASLASRYPVCASLGNGVGSPDVFVAVPANFTLQENRTAISNLVFGASGLVGFFINVFLLEVYLRGTKGESERLGKVGEARRRAVGLEKKGQ